MTQQLRLKLPKWSQNNVVLLNVRLNDHTLIRMILDTGAKYTTITPGVATRLQLDLEVAQSVPISTASQLRLAHLVQLAKVDVHGFTITDVEAAVMDLPSTFGVDGLLGVSFLCHCQLLLDYPNLSLELTSPLS